MDRITKGLLTEFVNEFGIAELPEERQFEHLCSYVAVRKHYSERAFHSRDLVMGDGGDTGIDGIGVIVNNSLVTDIDDIEELLEINGYLDVTFVFIQAERSSSFDGSKIGTFGFGVRDFFGAGTLVRNEPIRNACSIMSAIFDKSPRFSKGNPALVMYYITTGRWQDDQNLLARRQSEVSYLQDTGNFRSVEFNPIGADILQRLYNQTKNKVERDFLFPQKVTLPSIASVTQSYIGLMGASDFLRIVCDEERNLIGSLFYENVRGWEGYNKINEEIRATITSDDRNRFVLMNNGVTIIAKSLMSTGDRFVMSDFQIVNGCQTSNVLYDNQTFLSNSVQIPVRIIHTSDESVIESVITATNRQTEVKEEQFFALKNFAKKLEVFFAAFDMSNRLFYERRSHQYDNLSIDRNRIVTHKDLVRAVGAMFLELPHRTTRSYREISDKVGRDFFRESDRCEPYYVAGYALYMLNLAFNSQSISSQYKVARYQILLVARLTLDSGPVPRMNSHDMERRCESMMEALWRDSGSILANAAARLNEIVSGNLDRDYIHSQRVTDAILDSFGRRRPGV